MSPSPGSRQQVFVGDWVKFTVQPPMRQVLPPGWKALLRTNLGRAQVLREEIIQAHTRGMPPAGASWRDIPMTPGSSGWQLELPLTEVGFFKAKCYLVDPQGWQHWPSGPNATFSVHPDQYRTANTIYCAFARMFDQTRGTRGFQPDKALLANLDKAGYAVIPPSGKLRDLTLQLPHIFDQLGCRILHLLPINPTPTTFARFGRYGSPYAVLDLTQIDPALVVFDRRSTGIDQFKELTYEVHRRNGRVFLDVVINHTGWGAILQETHPEWFLRRPDGYFVSPGAWGVTWEDLVEIKHDNVALWDILAEVFLEWCRRGTDGFRCDAGYKVPVAAWQYIIARVQQEYPETVFLLEGLGGAWEATETLLTEGGMQWAYSELFQNYSGREVSSYLDHSFAQSRQVGLLVHYSETHDNERLAARGRAWSLLRNRLCALTSVNGAFGFTCGVEWLASAKINVHSNTDLAWGKQENLIPELARLNQLLHEHPCFFDAARLTRLSADDSPVFALRRQSAEDKDQVLVLVNTDTEQARTLELGADFDFLWSNPHPDQGESVAESIMEKAVRDSAPAKPSGKSAGKVKAMTWVDLLGQTVPEFRTLSSVKRSVSLVPGAAYCLAPVKTPTGFSGEAYRQARQRAAWAMGAWAELSPIERITPVDWRTLAEVAYRDAAGFLVSISQSDFSLTHPKAGSNKSFPCVVYWSLNDARRATLVPPGCWLLLQHSSPFRASLDLQDGSLPRNVSSIQVQGGNVVAFAPRQTRAEALLTVEHFENQAQSVRGQIRFLSGSPSLEFGQPQCTDLVLLTNGRGGMARLAVDLGRIQSKYDCVLGANLHPRVPVDRHVFAKRLRVWVNADGFISPLDFGNLNQFNPGPPAIWNFRANAGDGRVVELEVAAEMVEESNTVLFRFARPTVEEATGKQLPAHADVRLTLRLDIEDRNFHWETKRNGGAEHHFSTNLRTFETKAKSGMVGFIFKPAADRQLSVYTKKGSYHAQPEWSENIPHPIEQSRGQNGCGDAYSPGWFDVPLMAGENAVLVVTAELPEENRAGIEDLLVPQKQEFSNSVFSAQDTFGQQLLKAARAFVVRRDEGKTVIAGYPWFLDWGRDTFICARGLLAAGLHEDVRKLLITFARFEQDGTLPNTIFGDDASNRDTSDAPLWFAMVCEELSRVMPNQAGEAIAGGQDFYLTPVNPSGRTLLDVLESIAVHYRDGTPNGIRMDPATGLIWSPSHFTWMDTNYPASTPREGYPVEIQALWVRLLRQLSSVCKTDAAEGWKTLAKQAHASLQRLFWLEEQGYFADVLIAKSGESATRAVASDALRSNCLFVVSLGLVEGTQAQRCVEAARRYLVVPGALRSLAPLPVKVPLPVYGAGGGLLNDPNHPYWGRYEGDEDTRRKPAYHNGTAWTWTFPVFCEAFARAWSFSPQAVASAKAYLGSMADLMTHGCLGQIPEILDGDFPHTQRGCDAQAWGVTEALRVWKLLEAS